MCVSPRFATHRTRASPLTHAAQEALAPAFERMFVLADRDWPRFLDSVRRLRSLTKAQRNRMLASLT